jgi:hypothetical protein
MQTQRAPPWNSFTATSPSDIDSRYRTATAWAAIIASVEADGTFEVVSFVPVAGVGESDIATALPVGVATMEKRYAGGVEGRSATLFTAAFDQTDGVGTYVAMESFQGSLNGVAGSFNFVHSATTSGINRSDEFFLIVASSGTGGLAGICGTGGLVVEPDGAHWVRFDYELA